MRNEKVELTGKLSECELSLAAAKVNIAELQADLLATQVNIATYSSYRAFVLLTLLSSCLLTFLPFFNLLFLLVDRPAPPRL